MGRRRRSLIFPNIKELDLAVHRPSSAAPPLLPFLNNLYPGSRGGSHGSRRFEKFVTLPEKLINSLKRFLWLKAFFQALEHGSAPHRHPWKNLYGRA
jgi:hypothetical protein